MMSLSPAKLLVILVIALIVLGPEKLPQVARQMGAVWGGLRRWRGWVETEVRSTFPDLPPTHEVVSAVRSPLAFLDKLADAHERESAREQLDGKARDGPEARAVVSPARVDEPGEDVSENGSVERPTEGRDEPKPTSHLGAGELHAPEGACGTTKEVGPGMELVDMAAAPVDAGQARALSGNGAGEPLVALDDPSMN